MNAASLHPPPPPSAGRPLVNGSPRPLHSVPNLGHPLLFLPFLSLFVLQILSVLIHEYPLNLFPTRIPPALNSGPSD